VYTTVYIGSLSQYHRATIMALPLLDQLGFRQLAVLEAPLQSCRLVLPLKDIFLDTDRPAITALM
jgi:hypothetical protein